ncbi:MAG: Gx transporter family protein [Clostridia bacterium]|nr:Gx transporter family protein [Clostridia bacterium]
MKKTAKIAFCGLFTAIAFGLSWVEMLIPFDSLGIPGVKLGLANLAVMAALYLLGLLPAAAVSLARILLSWFVFGSFTAFIYSLCGGVLSLAVMYILKRAGFFGCVGVSVSGAVAHNAGQLAAACALLHGTDILYYAPVLLAAATLAGALNGALLGRVLPALKKRFGAAE